jgi:hypothetical protein
VPGSVEYTYDGVGVDGSVEKGTRGFAGFHRVFDVHGDWLPLFLAWVFGIDVSGIQLKAQRSSLPCSPMKETNAGDL